MKFQLVFIAVGALLLISFPLAAVAFQKGIYINQSTAENPRFLNYLIKRAKSVGINTFVVDVARVNPVYKRNIAKVKRNGLRFVARVVIFPGGGNHGQITSRHHWDKKYRLINHAVNLGADEIQLDYIRYNTKRPASRQNAHHVHRVIKYYKNKLLRSGVPLQIAVFGETSFGPSHRIGQNVRVFAPSVDVVNPMVYPSHYEPYKVHSRQPYKTVFSSLKAMKHQFRGRMPFRLIPYIETYNYRYRLPGKARHDYIHAQLRAVQDANAHGWYAWSANNRYEPLFQVLSNRRVK